MKLEKYSTSTSRGFSSKDKPQLPDVKSEMNIEEG
ncbi:unnamed protein product [Brassica oleracea var. botrytis]